MHRFREELTSIRSLKKSPQRFLDIMRASKYNVTNKLGNHLRLIEGCLQPDRGKPDLLPSGKKNPIELIHRLHKEGLKTDPGFLSNALSVCCSERAVNIGIQIHCLVMKNGCLTNVYVGSSLVSLYSKCGSLEVAHNLFEEMPIKNVVSWTTVIHGFSQVFQVDVCLKLYMEMLNHALMPNDYTFTSLLSACTGSGCFGQAKSVHCQTICTGYAQHGLAPQAIDLFEQMKDKRVKPDSITFLGILSACRHAGLVEQGWFYFNSMALYDEKPRIDHFSCIVDLLGRAGRIEEAHDMIKKMCVSPNGVIWGSLLMSSRLHGNAEVGIEAAENRLMLEPGSRATHLQLANLYASIGLWHEAARVRKEMKSKWLKIESGCSWIEIRNEIHCFRVEDGSFAEWIEVVPVMYILADHMRDHGKETISELYCN
ncbi:unnamed protein product [Cuscuta epithymum]|uniref:Pentatricopeptide repeat-containing protein n=1 Tax=Cuscuta epithymum TaxID=186058 RepID=A0AAV0DBQ2_9ASTE|nr:unnamed protein product [Cuscuta epithymum]CAH9097757.1 unnamed protein product [Cuscuta epithymum]